MTSEREYLEAAVGAAEEFAIAAEVGTPESLAAQMRLATAQAALREHDLTAEAADPRFATPEWDAVKRWRDSEYAETDVWLDLDTAETLKSIEDERRAEARYQYRAAGEEPPTWL